MNSDGSGDLAGSTSIIFTTNEGWNNIDLSGQNIVVSGGFWIAYKWLGQFQSPCLALEYPPPPTDGRSFYGSPGSWTKDGTYDYLIRVVIDPAAAAVGGIVVPTNTLAVLAPYLAVIGLVVIAAVAIRKRKLDAACF